MAKIGIAAKETRWYLIFAVVSFFGYCLEECGSDCCDATRFKELGPGFDDILIIAVLIKGVWARYCVEQCIASRRSRQLGKGA